MKNEKKLNYHELPTKDKHNKNHISNVISYQPYHQQNSGYKKTEVAGFGANRGSISKSNNGKLVASYNHIVAGTEIKKMDRVLFNESINPNSAKNAKAEILSEFSIKNGVNSVGIKPKEKLNSEINQKSEKGESFNNNDSVQNNNKYRASTNNPKVIGGQSNNESLTNSKLSESSNNPNRAKTAQVNMAIYSTYGNKKNHEKQTVNNDHRDNIVMNHNDANNLPQNFTNDSNDKEDDNEVYPVDQNLSNSTLMVPSNRNTINCQNNNTTISKFKDEDQTSFNRLDSTTPDSVTDNTTHPSTNCSEKMDLKDNNEISDNSTTMTLPNVVIINSERINNNFEINKNNDTNIISLPKINEGDGEGFLDNDSSLKATNTRMVKSPINSMRTTNKKINNKSSVFPIDGHSNQENLWEFLYDFGKDSKYRSVNVKRQQTKCKFY